jgi:ribosomal protein S18 acetylase RimI-like enzyme
MDILIREATIDDAALIAELTRSSWANKVNQPSRAHHEEAQQVAEDLHLGGGFVLLCDHEPAGSVRWKPLDTEMDVWEVYRMGVTPAYRGERLSQHLMEALIHRALVADIDELRLAVRPDQMQLVDLYAALGFEIAPELDYARNNPEEAHPIVMRRWVKA